MASANTNWVKMYYDIDTDTVNNAASFRANLGVLPMKNSKRFIYIGSYQCRQNFPYNTNEGVARSYYGREIIILSAEKISQFKDSPKK